MLIRICKKDGQEKKSRRRWGKLFFGFVLFPAALYTLWRYDQKHPLMQGDASLETEDGEWENYCTSTGSFDEQASSKDTDTSHSSSEQKSSSEASHFSSMQEEQTIEAENTAAHEEGGNQFIGNSSTKKFHLTQCMAVDKIGETEKTVFHSYEEALAAGFVPCKRCNPTL